MIYLTSDLHLCHDREFIWGPRGFRSVDENDVAIVEKWNDIVAPNDDVYLLGDIMLNDNERGMEYFKSLKGNIHIVFGNHDTPTRQVLYTERPNTEILGHAHMLRYKKYNFFLCHYPTMTSNLDDGSSLHQRIINLYGHTHQQTNFYHDMPWMYHVGVDSHNCVLCSLDAIISDIKFKAEECLNML